MVVVLYFRKERENVIAFAVQKALLTQWLVCLNRWVSVYLDYWKIKQVLLKDERCRQIEEERSLVRLKLPK